MLKKLNLGCGNDIKREEDVDWVNLDISPDVGADVVADFVQTPWPADDDSFDEVLANNSLTQVLTSREYIDVINEIWRITKPDGVIKIRVPYALHPCAFQDPIDCRRFTEESFTYMDINHRRYEEYGKHYGFPPFYVKLIDNNGVQMKFELRPVK